MKRQLLLILLIVSSLHGAMARILTLEDSLSTGLGRSNSTTGTPHWNVAGGKMTPHESVTRQTRYGAEASKEFVLTLSQDDRDKLIKFLESR